ncbi:Unconventional myosin-Va [Phytophthora rubi]|uniref:Unconventional myosin-Va n=1 Tax=Phytophthora rubi TaxID=129364 RepID=A0A6A4G2C4_9STRA|nr:Unconventional myosin-Va [Phytophthora rubi]KAE9052418.1 Unconventional myosin-Va [Phytophthora rubi]KAE9359387.1 Unconventional myosin-Va [Phytophthora rubi]
MEGIRVFIPDEKLVWVPATVLSVDASGKVFRVRVQPLASPSSDYAADAPAQERTIDLNDDGMPDSLPLQNGPHEADDEDAKHAAVGAEDMCELGHLHEPAIVYNVRERFFAQQPYTYTGKIVVAVNPYQWIKEHYSEQLRDLYTQRPWDDMPPHVYATSAEAFHHMKQHRIPQSILVSGESGAGKTETVKIMMEHLASISMGIAKRLHPAESGETIVVEKVLKSNPLLEAFGNAKTIRNDNSSRFGKFTQLQFNADYCLVGAECRHYLLEKSRVVAQAAGERNYHIFYQLVSAKEQVFGFQQDTSAKEFRYLQDEQLILDGQTDLERYQVTRDALTTIGLSDKEQNELFSALCGILRLGQLDFVPLESNKDDASQAVAAASASDSVTAEQIEQQKIEIEQCAKLLGVEVAALSKQLCSRTVKARQEVYCVPLSALHAGNNRDALAKEIYARVFGYLVRRVNHSISNSADRGASTPSYLHIDLLDIFGFESFEHNSFEQFCINFANEKLQQKFTLDVFKTVQEEYQQEGVAWEFVKYRDNQDMLDLLENSMGVMALLNEECVRPMGSDLSFVSKLVSLRESHPRLERARLSQMHFMLHHYAGPVTYDAEGFVEKNKDSLQTDLLELLGTSSNGLMSMVFSDDDNTAFMTDADLAVRAATMMETGRRSTVSRKTSTFMQETVSYKFKAQLSLLMSDISSTEVHYVRCIKPNSEKSPNTYEIDSVVSQLRCAGVVEAIRITRAAFPNKMAHEKFLRRFVMMRSMKDVSAASATTTVTEACEQLAKELLSGDDFAKTQEGGEHSRTPTFVVGKSLVYFGKDVLEFLEHRRTTFVHERAIVIQQTARRWMAQRRIKKVRTMISKVQALHRCRMQRRSFLEKRKKCIIVQSVWRGVRSRQRVYLLLKEKSAIKVQTAYRKYLSEKKYAKFRNAVIKIQSTLKMKKQVGKYHTLLSERKEQDAMETEVELLKHRLEDEKRARMEIEAENSSLQQELNQVRSSSVPSAESSIYESEGPPTFRNSMRSSRIERESMDDGKLLDDSERMIDYLRKEVTKGRELIQMLSQENENLKSENKKIKDAYTAAGASFAALNQHNKQQSKANLRLMSTHAALIKSQEEKMKKYKKQVAELKEDLRMQRSVYSAELKARVQQQEVLVDIINLAESDGVSEDLLERMRAMAVDSKPSYENGRRSSEYTRPPTGRRSSAASSKAGIDSEHRDKRSDTATSLGTVPVSVSMNSNPARTDRRATLDTIMNNPVPHGASPQGEGMSPPDRGSLNRGSLHSDDGHRKSRIGGMFKKMFKKDE